MAKEFNLRPMLASDYPAVAKIFQQGIDGGNATFEIEPPKWDRWDQDHFRIGRWVVAEDSTSEVVGWAALSFVSNRNVFRGVAELSIYIHNDYQSQGIGKVLMNKIIQDSEENGIWMLQSGIFPENATSIHLHKKMGFREVGFREKIGQMPVSNIWRDILILERRSRCID